MSYQVRDYTLPPGQTVTIQIVGNECAVYEATKDFRLSHGHLDPEYINGGMTLAPKGGFTQLVMLNPHDEPVTVKLGITDGQIRDNRLSTSAPVQVSEIQTPVEISKINDPVKIVDEAGYLSSLSNGFYEVPHYEAWAKVPKHKIGTSFMYVQGVGSSPVTLIDPDANNSGVIVRTVVANNAAGNGASIFAGTSAPASWVDPTKRQLYNFYSSYTQCYNYCDPIHLPAGDGLYFLGNQGGSGSLSITWDYL